MIYSSIGRTEGDNQEEKKGHQQRELVGQLLIPSHSPEEPNWRRFTYSRWSKSTVIHGTPAVQPMQRSDFRTCESLRPPSHSFPVAKIFEGREVHETADLGRLHHAAHPVADFFSFPTELRPATPGPESTSARKMTPWCVLIGREAFEPGPVLVSRKFGGSAIRGLKRRHEVVKA